MDFFVSSTAACSLVSLVMLLAALPPLAMLEPKLFAESVRKPLNWLYALIGVLVCGALLAFFAGFIGDAERLTVWGRLLGAIIHMELIATFFALLFPILLFVWPHGGAVALAAFREGIRQPLFWMIVIIAVGSMLVSIVIPYWTFGEDLKMVKEMGVNTCMISAVIFCVLASSMSISDEIEGRTAITVMSKPVSRRQFLVGKFLGIMAATALMTALLAWVFNIVLYLKPIFDKEPPLDPMWLVLARNHFKDMLGEPTANFLGGAAYWFSPLFEVLPGLIFGLSQAMVLLSFAVALATRLPMIVNLLVCFIIFLLGHLTHILVLNSATKGYKLINFVAQAFDTILPGLDYFDASALLAKDVIPPPTELGIHVAFVVLYAVMWSTIALVFGLILFEDRDLA